MLLTPVTFRDSRKNNGFVGSASIVGEEAGAIVVCFMVEKTHTPVAVLHVSFVAESPSLHSLLT